jgi:hypothetical protein
MSVTPAANQTRVFAGTGIMRKDPDEAGRSFGVMTTDDPQAVTAGNVDLNGVLHGHAIRG